MEKVLLLANPETTQLLRPMLQDAGYDNTRVISVTSLQEGLAHELSDKAAILCGMEVSDAVFPSQLDRLTERFPYTPIIVLADSPSRDTVITAMRHGAQDVLVKDKLTADQLRKALEDAVEKRIFREYQRLFEETPTPIFIFDNETLQFLTVNRAALHHYGYSKEEFLRFTATDLLPEGGTDRYWEVPARNYDAGKSLHQKKNGETFYMHVYAHTTQFAYRPATLILAFNIDEKEKMEQALQEKTQELQGILESITDAFYTVDEEWRFTHVNSEYEKMQKRTREQLIGTNIWEQFPYKKHLLFYEEFQRAVRDKVSVHFEEYHTESKLWVWVTAYPFKRGLAVYFRNISEQKRIQQKIHNDEQNLRAIINNTKDLIWSVDKNYNIITANQAFWDRITSLTGKTGILDNADLDPTLLKTYVQLYKRAFKGVAFKTIKENDSAEQQYEELSFNPIFDHEKQVTGVTCFLRDVTKQYHHLDKIETQNKQLREIAWIQSHMVRAPLANILGLIQLLDTEREHPSQHAELVTMIRHSAGQLDDTIREINLRTEILNDTLQ